MTLLHWAFLCLAVSQAATIYLVVVLQRRVDQLGQEEFELYRADYVYKDPWSASSDSLEKYRRGS